MKYNSFVLHIRLVFLCQLMFHKRIWNLSPVLFHSTVVFHPPTPPLPTRIQFWASFRPIIRTRIHNVDMVDTRLEPRLFGCLRNQPDALDIEERIGLLWETIHSQFRHRFQTDGGEPTITTRHPEPTQNGTGHLPRRVRQ